MNLSIKLNQLLSTPPKFRNAFIYLALSKIILLPSSPLRGPLSINSHIRQSWEKFSIWKFMRARFASLFVIHNSHSVFLSRTMPPSLSPSLFLYLSLPLFLPCLLIEFLQTFCQSSCRPQGALYDIISRTGRISQTIRLIHSHSKILFQGVSPRNVL